MRLTSRAVAILLWGLITCIPYVFIFMGDELFTYIQNQHYGYIYIFKIEYFPYWFKEFIAIGSSVLLFLSLLGNGLRIWLGRISILIILLAWSIIVNTSFGTIEPNGIFFRSPSTYYDTQKVSWKEVGNATLEIAHRTYGRSNRLTYGILNVEANNELIEIPFEIEKKDNREKLIEVLRFLRQKDIHVKMHFEDSARVEILQYIDKDFLDNLRTFIVETN